jgi:hypothetical protein
MVLRSRDCGGADHAADRTPEFKILDRSDAKIVRCSYGVRGLPSTRDGKAANANRTSVDPYRRSPLRPISVRCHAFFSIDDKWAIVSQLPWERFIGYRCRLPPSLERFTPLIFA